MAELFSSIDQGDYFNSVLMGGISSGPFGHMVMGSIVSDRRVAKIIEHEGDVGNEGMRELSLAFFEGAFSDRVENYVPGVGGQVYSAREYAVDVGLFLCSRYCSEAETVAILDRWCDWCDEVGRIEDSLFIGNIYVQMLERRSPANAIATLANCDGPRIAFRKLYFSAYDPETPSDQRPVTDVVSVLPAGVKTVDSSIVQVLKNALLDL